MPPRCHLPPVIRIRLIQIANTGLSSAPNKALSERNFLINVLSLFLYFSAFFGTFL